MSRKRFVAVTSCAAGIAHTYMAQAALEKAAVDLGMIGKVETQGTIGTENELTQEEIQNADVVIIAADVTVDKSRFIGKRLLEVDTNAALKDANALVNQALESAEIFSGKGTKVAGGKVEIGTTQNKIIRHLMSGLTDMIPIAIAAGLLLAFANCFAFQPDPANPELVIWGFEDSASGEFFSKMFELGQIGFTLMIPVFAAGIARSIGDRPAWGPALIGGYIINSPAFLGTDAGAGFLGAIVVGFGVGYLVKFLREIKWPNIMKPIVPILIIPMIATFITFVAVYYLVGPPIAIMMEWLYAWINEITVTYAAAPIIYGAIFGAMIGFDMGGPVNKTAVLVSGAIFADTMAQYGPEGVNGIPAAAVGAAIAVAPLGAGIATMMFKERFTTEEKAMGVSAFTMGMVGVSEGAIPFAAAHPRLILANTASSAIAGAIVAGAGIHFYGGIGSPSGAVVGYMNGPEHARIIWIAAIFFAAFINALLYGWLLRKRRFEHVA